MVVITEIPDGDPNKKPQEEEQEKKSFSQLRDDIIEIFVAHTRRFCYPKLSVAGDVFRRIIRSEALYEKRSSLGVTEPILYVSISFPPCEKPEWYILHRNHVGESLRLCKIASLTPAPWGSAVVTIGPMMYVFGGSVDNNPTSDVIRIDCRLHESDSLPRMERARSRAVAGAIDGKIYVIGGCVKRSMNWVEVYDVKSNTWSDVPGELPFAHWEGQFVTCAVMDEKIYVLDPNDCLIFDPRVGRLVSWEDGSALRSLWQASSCVVDDMLYTIDPGCSLESPIVVYDPKAEEKKWRPVKGVVFGKKFPSFTSYYDSKMANLGGKLVILVGDSLWFRFGPHGSEDICCITIALERREFEGDYFEMWGKVESMTRVLTSSMWPSIEVSRTVTV